MTDFARKSESTITNIHHHSSTILIQICTRPPLHYPNQLVGAIRPAFQGLPRTAVDASATLCQIKLSSVDREPVEDTVPVRARSGSKSSTVPLFAADRSAALYGVYF